jgi:hypothetical protein
LLPAQERVTPITPPAGASSGTNETRFSFIAYGDNRESIATGNQATHARLVDSMLERVKQASGTNSPIRLVVQSGDGVITGANAGLWNNNFNPIVNRLTAAGLPYYMAAGNHDVTAATTHTAGGRQVALHNFLDAIGGLIPPDGSPRRLSGYPTYGVGYGNSFFITFDSNLLADDAQFAWVKSQLEGLNRTQYKHVFVFCHQQVFSSGPHGADRTEAATLELRNRYMPLFRQHHVTAVISGHEHFFEHWAERYTDASGEHRMDLIVSGGAGAPSYVFRSLPETKTYIDASPDSKIKLEQLVQPGAVQGSNPNHYLIVNVDGDKVSMEVVAPGAATPYAPYNGSTQITLQ